MRLGHLHSTGALLAIQGPSASVELVPMPLPIAARRQACADLLARVAIPPTTMAIGILRIEGMPVHTVRLPGLSCRGSVAPKNIRPVGDGLQMTWPDTPPVPTEMIDRQPGGKASLRQFVSDAMGINHPTAIPELSVLLVPPVSMAPKLPAITTGIDANPETGQRRDNLPPLSTEHTGNLPAVRPFAS